jgi:ABC-type phosphate/phosphonate transport system permease subunit
MPVSLANDGGKSWRRHTSASQWLRFLGWLALVMLFVFTWRVMTQDTIWAFVTDAPRQAADIGSRMWPPRWSYMNALWKPLWDTINMATLGTLLAIVLAVPIALLTARNTTPSAILVRPIALLVIVSSRSINALIWALLLVTILGPGVLAGVIAIALRSVGFIAKLLYEAIEEINLEPVEAIRAHADVALHHLLVLLARPLVNDLEVHTIARTRLDVREPSPRQVHGVREGKVVQDASDVELQADDEAVLRADLVHRKNGRLVLW